MKHHCPKCEVQTVLIWQPNKRRLYCPRCHLNFMRREVALIIGGKP